MADRSHSIGTNWRDRDAEALEERVTAISDWLDHTEDLTAMLGDDDPATTELRTMSGILKTRRNDFRSKANALRAELGKES